MAMTAPIGSAAAELQIQRLDKDLPLPTYAHAGDAGVDLCAASSLTIPPGERALIPTGLKLAIPAGYAGLVLPRSGLALRRGLAFVNSPGLIDSSYRGEVRIIALNTDMSQPLVINRGDRIAQMVVIALPTLQIVEREELDATERGGSGFGSSGV